MGCDVHPKIEVEKWPGRDDPWIDVAELHFWRDYTAFGLMAGVRGEEKLFAARGYAPLLSTDLNGDHTPSWLTTQEFRQVLERMSELGREADESYWSALAYMEDTERRGFRARLVFNFDS